MSAAALGTKFLQEVKEEGLNEVGTKAACSRIFWLTRRSFSTLYDPSTRIDNVTSIQVKPTSTSFLMPLNRHTDTTLDAISPPCSTIPSVISEDLYLSSLGRRRALVRPSFSTTWLGFLSYLRTTRMSPWAVMAQWSFSLI